MNSILQDIAWSLVHFLWQGTLIAFIAKIALTLLKRSSASIRYATALIALLAMIASVAGTMVHLHSGRLSITHATTMETTVPQAVSSNSSILVVKEITKSKKTLAVSSHLPRSIDSASLHIDWKLVVAIAWAVGVFALSTWRLVGLLVILRLRRRLTLAPERLQDEFQMLLLGCVRKPMTGAKR